MSEPAFLCSSLYFPHSYKMAAAAPGIAFAIKGRRNRKRWWQSFLFPLKGKNCHGAFLVGFRFHSFGQDCVTWPFMDAREPEHAQYLCLQWS